MSMLKTQPVNVELDGRTLRCLVCSQESFHKRRTHLDTAMLAEMNPQWSDSEGHCLICDHCGYIHWFLRPR